MKQRQAKKFRDIGKLILDSAAEAETEQDRDECLMLAQFYEQSARLLEQRTKQRLHGDRCVFFRYVTSRRCTSSLKHCFTHSCVGCSPNQ